MTEDDRENAIVMIASIRAALKNGVRHYTEAGMLLENEIEIVTALKNYGVVECDESNRVEVVTSVETELAALRRVLDK